MPLSDLDLFRQSPLVAQIVREEHDGDCANSDLRIKIRVELTNGWLVDMWERSAPGFRRYSYHVFQEGQIITRWDNAAHHAHLENFPHHQHVGDTIVSSEEMDVASVLAQLESMI